MDVDFFPRLNRWYEMGREEREIYCKYSTFQTYALKKWRGMHFKHKPNSWQRNSCLDGITWLCDKYGISTISQQATSNISISDLAHAERKCLSTRTDRELSHWSLYALQMCKRIRLAKQNRTNMKVRQGAEAVQIISLGFLKPSMFPNYYFLN